MNPTIQALGTTIFETTSALAREHGAINLGQGFPDAPGPRDVLDAAAQALVERSNQYPPMNGLPELRDAIAAHYRAHQGLELSRENVIVTSGATEALAAAILAAVSDGDEVLVFEPMYDAYRPLIERAGGVARPVPLSPPHWGYDRAAIEAVISPRTRAIVLNDPHNPTGKVCTPEERHMLADVCVQHDLIALCDEVWEHMRFDGIPHRSLLAEPGMAERTIKIGSAGKIFSLTGWKVGWICAAPALAGPLSRAHQYLAFTTPPNLQWAVAEGLAKPSGWFEQSRRDYAASRRRLTAGLERAGYAMAPAQATWFVTIDLAASGIALDDQTFCDRLVREAGVAAIPLSAFCTTRPDWHMVRLCFTKADDVLDEAVQRMAAFRNGLK